MRVFEDQEHQHQPATSENPDSLRELPPLASPDGEEASPEDQQADTEANTQGFLPVLKNSRFLVLWSGQIFSQLADKIYLVLMISLIASYFSVSEEGISNWVSAIMISFTIPAVLFGSLAGVYVDRWLKKSVLVSTNLVRGGLVLAIPPLLWLAQDWGTFFNVPVGFSILLVITFLVSTLTQFFAPAEQSTIPLIVKRKHLLPANSLYTTTMMALLIVGFAVGEPLLAVMDKVMDVLSFGGSYGKEILVGGSYAIAGLLLLVLKTGENKESLHVERPHVFQDIWDGILYLKENHEVRNAMIQLVMLFCVFAALAVLAVPLAADIPELKAEQFGFLLAGGGVGLGIGAAFIGHWGSNFPHGQLSLWGSVGVAGSLIGLSLSSESLTLALIMTALLGAFAALVGVPMQTTIQAETPEEKRGKVFGLQNNAVNIALSLPLALAGVAESIWGLQAVLLTLAGLVLTSGVLTWYISRAGVVISTGVNNS
ncbi:MAG: MFS transporter [Kamptonema sp. SIO4C4]|nr:MFS transporter [Kamptonema sp. SIO4C4]